VRELDGHPPARAPAELHGDRPALLRFILGRTMGAADAFEHRRTELTVEGRPTGDGDVADSFVEDLSPGGALADYLAQVQLAYRHDETLFVHGAVTDASLGHVPERPRTDDVDAWIEALNAFGREQVARFLAREPGASWAGIIAYQAPAPGLPTNPSSVVYGRLADEINNPSLPSHHVVRHLREAGLRRLVLGHTPCGDTPAVLRGGGFEMVVGDNSRGRVPTGSGIEIDGSVLRVRGDCVLDTGETVEVAFTRHLDDDARIGLRELTTGRLAKGPTTDGRLTLYRGLPGYTIEQTALAADDRASEGFVEPWPAS
jgi:hypothetical protein